MTEQALIIVPKVFEGKPITTIVYRGRPCWIAREVGLAIGYADPRSFISRITGEWSREMLEEKHFAVISGSDLNELRDLVTQNVMSRDLVPSRAPSVLVLFEAGLHMALLKTNKEMGKKLRDFLAGEVLPQIVRDGRYMPEREVTPEGQLVDRAQSEAARLAVEREKLEFERRKLAADALWRLCDVLKNPTYLSQEIKDSLAVKAAEEASGRSLAGLLPPADESYQWESPTDIGKRLGISSHAVGRAISALGLRGVEGMSREIVNKAQHSNRTVTSWLYSPAAVAQIEKYLREHGCVSSSATPT